MRARSSRGTMGRSFERSVWLQVQDTPARSRAATKKRAHAMTSSRSCFVLGSFVASLALSGAALAQVVEFPVPTANSRPYTIVAGPDGNMWFTESNGNKIGRITPNGNIVEFPVPTPASGPYGIAVGPDGNIWFTERFGNQIGRLEIATGTILEFPIPTSFSQPWEICAGADGNMWFTEEDVPQIGLISMFGQIVEFSQIGCCFPTGIIGGPDLNVWYTLEIGDQISQIQPNGVSTQFQIQSVQVLPWDITAGPDGNLWFTELSGRAVGSITTSGTIVEHPIPGQFSGIAGIATGPDGNLYFTENDTHQIGGITPTGTVLPTTYPTSDRPLSICVGPDGNMWFTVADGNMIGRLALAKPRTNYVLSMDAGFSPTIRNSRIGEKVQWIFTGPNVHSVADPSGLGLFTSGPKSQVSYFTKRFDAAGAYVYKDISQVYRRGAINVPVVLPSTGSVGTPFNVTWANPALPAGNVEDVIVQVPGAGTYVPFVTGSTASSGQYTPTAPGDYLFRARLRNPTTNKACVYSRPAKITVL